MEYFDALLLNKRIAHYAGPVEVHITAQVENTSLAKTRFQTACRALGGKSIWIELEDGETVNQPMFGLRMRASPKQQTDKIRTAVQSLSQDFPIKRVKVEAGPQNANIPQSAEAARTEPPDCYFEHHVALRLTSGRDLSQLKSKLACFDGYLSKNAFKSAPSSGEHIRFVTQRFSDIGQSEAHVKLGALLDYAAHEGLTVLRTEREYNIYDSNLGLDNGWMR